MSFPGELRYAVRSLAKSPIFAAVAVLSLALGRLFTAEEDRTQGSAPLAVLSYDHWKTRFAGDPSVIGKEILINNQSALLQSC